MQCADVGVNVRMLADRHDALAFVRMAEMRHDDLHVGKTNRDGIEMTRQRAFQRRLCNEGRSRVQQDRQACVSKHSSRADRGAARPDESPRTSIAV